MELCLSANSLQEVFEVLVPKTGTVGDMLAELKKKANLEDAIIENVRVYCILSGKISKELSTDYPVSSILDHQSLIAQKLPKEDLEPAEGNRAIYAFHFDKEPARVHGIPFIFHLNPVSTCTLNVSPLSKPKQYETLKDSKVRLSKRTGLKGKQFDNIKFALVSKSAYLKPQYLKDGE